MRWTSTVLFLVVSGLACRPAGSPAPAASCRPGLFPVLGACVTAEVARDYCGTSSRPAASGCDAAPPCPPAGARDLDRGGCAPPATVRALGRELGLRLGEGDAPACAAGELAVGAPPGAPRSERLACLPSWACPRGTRLAGGVCSPEPRCAPGALPDAAGGACEAVVRSDGRGDASVVDVARWMRAAVGVDGGPGAPPLCAALARAPAALAGPEHDLDLDVVLRIPGNDVSQVDLRARLVGGAALPPGVSIEEVGGDIDRAVSPLAEALRALGGTASVAGAVRRVRCRRGAALPFARKAEANEERKPL